MVLSQMDSVSMELTATVWITAWTGKYRALQSHKSQFSNVLYSPHCSMLRFRAISAWFDARDWFHSLCKRVMEQDWSWNRPALDYIELYHSARKLWDPTEPMATSELLDTTISQVPATLLYRPFPSVSPLLQRATGRDFQYPPPKPFSSGNSNNAAYIYGRCL